MKANTEFYRKKLPHIQPKGHCFFVTASLYGALPKIKLTDLKEQYLLERSRADLIQNEKEKNTFKLMLSKKYIVDSDRLLHKLNCAPTT